jgi:pyruvate-ferredoxin/flavodoxin oxidoreductase
VRDAVDGNTAVIHVERESSDAAGAYPITPSTQMGEYWAEEVAKGHLNISNKPLIFIEPESEHAAAGVTAGMAMTGLRASNFSSAQGVAFMHESLYAAVGKRLPYVLNMGCRAITKASLNVHAGHDDYHCVDDTGFIQMMAKNATEAADLNLIGRKLAELSLTPAIIGQDGFLTSHLIESCVLPERELVAEYLRQARRHDRLADPGAGDALRAEAAPRAGDLGRGPAAAVRLGAEPGCLHAGHGRPASVLSSTTSRRWPTACMEEYAGLPGAATSACRASRPRMPITSSSAWAA